MMSKSTSSGFRIKGWHVLAGFIAFFGVGIAVNTVFVVQAITTFRGEDVRRSYVQGLSYNDILDDRQAQADLGWQASVNLQDATLLVAIRDDEGQPVSGLQFEARLTHPADMDMDRDLDFSLRSPGLYEAPVVDLPEGRWVLEIASRGERPFSMEYELWQRSP